MPYPPRIRPQIADALSKLFAPDELRTLALRSCGIDVIRFAPIGAFGVTEQFYSNVAERLDERDLIADLIVASLGERPRSRELQDLATNLGLSAASHVVRKGERSTADGWNLEKAVREFEQHVDAAKLLGRLALAEQRTGSIEYAVRGNRAGFGTGFLIGADKVLTNWHVAESISNGTIAPSAVRFRLGLRKDLSGRQFDGVTVALAGSWLGANARYARYDIEDGQPEPEADELDFAVLNLADPIGAQKVDGATLPASEPRGWFKLSESQPPPPANEPIFVLGHPVDRPLTVSLGNISEHAASGLRIRHNAWTLKGSSGSPVLDADGNLIALHHASEPTASNRARYNQAIPMTLIAGRLNV